MLPINLGSSMKSLLLIALTIASVSAFAETHEKDAHKAAMEACAKEHKGDKAKTEACVAEKTKAAAPAAATTPAPKK